MGRRSPKEEDPLPSRCLLRGAEAGGRSRGRAARRAPVAPWDVHFAVAERRIEAQRVFDGLVAALDACEGVEVVNDALVSEAEVSLDEIRVMKRWSIFDSLSLRDEEEAVPRVEPTR